MVTLNSFSAGFKELFKTFRSIKKYYVVIALLPVLIVFPVHLVHLFVYSLGLFFPFIMTCATGFTVLLLLQKIAHITITKKHFLIIFIWASLVGLVLLPTKVGIILMEEFLRNLVVGISLYALVLALLMPYSFDGLKEALRFGWGNKKFMSGFFLSVLCCNILLQLIIMVALLAFLVLAMLLHAQHIIESLSSIGHFSLLGLIIVLTNFFFLMIAKASCALYQQK